jgi:hypothetical protein
MTTNELDLSLVDIHMLLKFQSDRNKTAAARPLQTEKNYDRQTNGTDQYTCQKNFVK